MNQKIQLTNEDWSNINLIEFRRIFPELGIEEVSSINAIVNNENTTHMKDLIQKNPNEFTSRLKDYKAQLAEVLKKKEVPVVESKNVKSKV